jgi:hypothetical protein
MFVTETATASQRERCLKITAADDASVPKYVGEVII